MNCIDFILIGAMKSGSTTLIEYLRRHPGIFIPRIKEPQYFSRDHVYQRGIEWYESLFKDAQENQIRGEGSTCYTRWPKYPNAAERIFSYAPNVKLIYLVRNPVDRAYSHFRHGCLQNEWWYDSFDEALESENEIIASSKYMMQIEKYLKYFPRESMHFIKFEDLVSAKPEIFSNLFNFLKIENIEVINNAPIVSNVAATVKVERNLKRLKRSIRRIQNIPILSGAIYKFFSSTRRELIIDYLARSVMKSPMGRMLVDKRKVSIPHMTEENREYIYLQCISDIKEFEEFSKLDLSSWGI